MAEKIAGYTSEMCQQAMIDELKELFRDMKFNGQESPKSLQIFKQFLPIQTNDDDDVDTNDSMYPCIIVIETSGEQNNEQDPQLVLIQLVICCYDRGIDRQGYVDTVNIKETIMQHFKRKPVFGGAFEGLKSLCKLPMNAVIGMINGAISGINKLGLKIPDWVPEIGGKNFSINIPKIPMLAIGTKNWRGGFAQISERGGEIVDLPKGSRVYPHDETVRKAYSDGAKSSRGSSIVIAKLADTIVVREEADIDKIATRIVNKLSDTSKNLGGAELGYLY